MCTFLMAKPYTYIFIYVYECRKQRANSQKVGTEMNVLGTDYQLPV